MDERVEKWLWDIKLSIDDIEEYMGEERNFYEYQSSKLKRLAIERSLEIIGEAMNRILNRQPDISITHARSIVGLRNLIIHTYDKVDDSFIWKIVCNDLPQLKTEVNELLEAEE